MSEIGVGENGLFSSLLVWNVFSFCSWGSVERTCDRWQGHLKHSGEKGHDLSSGVCSGCQQLKSWSHVQPWFFWNLRGLSVTLNLRVLISKFFFTQGIWKAGVRVLFSWAGLFYSPRQAGWAGSESRLWVCLSSEEICHPGTVPSNLVSFEKRMWLSTAGAPLSPRMAVITAALALHWELYAVTASVVGLRLIQDYS